MWSGGISKRNPVRPAGKWAKGLTCQTAETPACHIQFVTAWCSVFLTNNPLALFSLFGIIHFPDGLCVFVFYFLNVGKIFK